MAGLLFVAAAGTGMGAVRRWTFIKRRLAAFDDLALVTQDGDDEGVIRLLRLPLAAEAAEIRRIIRLHRAKPPPVEGFLPHQNRVRAAPLLTGETLLPPRPGPRRSASGLTHLFPS
jgi:hypothetical protein